jgi:hypothetical protein
MHFMAVLGDEPTSALDRSGFLLFPTTDGRVLRAPLVSLLADSLFTVISNRDSAEAAAR